VKHGRSGESRRSGGSTVLVDLIHDVSKHGITGKILGETTTEILHEALFVLNENGLLDKKRGNEAFNAGHYPEASELYKKAEEQTLWVRKTLTNTDPTVQTLLFSQGFRELAQNAAACCGNVRKNDVLVSRKQGKHHEAVNKARLALMCDRTCRAFEFLLSSCEDLEDPGEAKRAFKLLRKLHKNDPSMEQHLQKAQKHLQRTERRIARSQEAGEGMPTLQVVDDSSDESSDSDSPVARGRPKRRTAVAHSQVDAEEEAKEAMLSDALRRLFADDNVTAMPMVDDSTHKVADEKIASSSDEDKEGSSKSPPSNKSAKKSRKGGSRRNASCVSPEEEAQMEAKRLAEAQAIADKNAMDLIAEEEGEKKKQQKKALAKERQKQAKIAAEAERKRLQDEEASKLRIQREEDERLAKEAGRLERARLQEQERIEREEEARLHKQMCRVLLESTYFDAEECLFCYSALPEYRMASCGCKVLCAECTVKQYASVLKEDGSVEYASAVKADGSEESESEEATTQPEKHIEWRSKCLRCQQHLQDWASEGPPEMGGLCAGMYQGRPCRTVE